MGTRHLIICKVDKKVKVAQYGQWDGYLTGQGLKIAEFIQDKLDSEWSLNSFKDKLRKVQFFSKKELDNLDELTDNLLKAGIAYPAQLSRDTGADILNIVYNIHQENLKLVNSIDFGEDDLFCEYSYILDFDKNILELYKGGPKKNNLIKKLKFSEVTTDKIKKIDDELNKNEE